MTTYNPRSVFQSYQQYGMAKTKQAQSSKPKNANQQAARSMLSAGIGGIGGKPITSAAQKIQDRFRRETQRDSGSTYDEVPQTITTGLGSKKTQPSKDEDMSVGTKIDRAFVKVMTSLIPDFSPPKEQAVFPLQVYGGPLFTVPTPTPVDIQELNDAARDTSRTFSPTAMEPPTLPTTATDSDTGLTTPKGLMSPPTMTQPKKPRGLMGIPRALAKANAVPTAAYQVQSGDTLSEIAAATGTTVKELADLNQISDVDVIEAGADLQIPIKRLEDEAVVTQATSMEDLKPIKASFRDVDPDAEFYSSFTQNVTPDSLMMGSYSFMDEGTEFTKALKAREADNYDTIFGNAEKRKSPFKGTKISNKTIKEVLDFVEFDGEFHKYNKGKGFNTTAVGKYQIVGQTLRDLDGRGVLKSLGITDDTKFDGPTQDKIAAHLAVNRIKNRATGGSGTLASRENARDEMRKEWEGFKKLSDKKLDKIIDEIAKDVGVTIYEGIDYKDPNPGKSIRPRIRPLGLPTGTDI